MVKNKRLPHGGKVSRLHLYRFMRRALLCACLQALFWLDIANCGRESGDASLVSAAMCLYFRSFHLFTFKLDDCAFLKYIGRKEVARAMELVRECI